MIENYLDKNNFSPGKILYATAFLIGCFAVLWMCSVFIYSNALALTVTLVIGCVYGVGAAELLQFRKATASLSRALLRTGEKVTDLDDWLAPVDASLHNSVRLRISGERVGLPAPVLTPYFVGLLVMLGLLGTFVGMIGTLKGAVIALEGTTELESIRAGLAAPIKGLGLAFGTSVAGVTTSAMLGLMSTLSKRDRMLTTRRLDTQGKIAFQDFSIVNSQLETFKALQVQTRALPEISNVLLKMAEKLEKVGDTLIDNQDRFQASVAGTFADLAVSMDKTHKESLEQNIRLAGESIKPVIKEAMNTIVHETRNVHKDLTQTSREYLDTISGHLTDTTAQVTRSVEAALADQHQANGSLIEQMRASLDDFKNQFEHLAGSLNESFTGITASMLDRLKTNDENRLAQWTLAMENTQAQAAAHLSQTSNAFSSELRQVGDMHAKTIETTKQELISVSEALTSQWQQAGLDALENQSEIAGTLKETLHAITSDMHTTSAKMQKEISGLLASSEELVRTRIRTEANWLDDHQKRMDALMQLIKSELLALRHDEEQRGQAAVDRLSVLESALADHLTTIGKAFEAPMIRLIETAEQAPRAAADVISHLRKEAAERTEQDTLQLEDQGRIIKEIESLSQRLVRTTTSQQAAIEQLVQESKGMLEDVACQFSKHMGTEADKFSDVAESFAVSAVEIASLGDAFSMAVGLFSNSNEQMIENLSRIEESLENATNRSDEQLGYYVAQAREIIDHCMLSQKEIFEDLQKMQHNHESALTG